MRLRSLLTLVVVSACAITGRAAPMVELELATERGVQITAPQEWLQLLARAGIENVRIRGAARGEEPSITNRGTPERPRYHVVGILTAREQLRLTGATFGRRDMGRLKDYLARISADGAESLTAPRGRYGLTESEMAAVFDDLAQPLNSSTKGKPPRDVLQTLRSRFALQFEIDAASSDLLGDASPVADELQGLSSGTALAILLRDCGLVLVPEKPRGKPVVLRITSADAATLDLKTIGRTDDVNQPFWPIGWEPDQLPRELAPGLFEEINAEIDGYTLEETLAAIGPRLNVPLIVDRASLRQHQLDPTAIKVRLPRARMHYKRILDRVLAQARLGAQLRVDEAGTPFLWVTR